MYSNKQDGFVSTFKKRKSDQCVSLLLKAHLSYQDIHTVEEKEKQRKNKDTRVVFVHGYLPAVRLSMLTFKNYKCMSMTMHVCQELIITNSDAVTVVQCNNNAYKT